MPRRPRNAAALVSDNTRIKNLINERLDAAITESISALDAYYAQEAHWPFELLKAFVDCREHLCKAQVIQHKELAQLSLPEPTNPAQAKLPLKLATDKEFDANIEAMANVEDALPEVIDYDKG